MELQLDKASATPLYQQIAEALAYRIATGRLAPGTGLPALRVAASAWDVNLHTVARAYRELANRGLVESRGGSGTRVLRSTLSTATDAGIPDALEAFLTRTLAESREVHGLEAAELARLMKRWLKARSSAPPTIHVLECSESQCRDHAREIEDRFGVRALPWPLSRPDEPPPGPLVATYFHYHEVRRRWPHRRDDTSFAAVQPDPEFLPSLEKRAPAVGEPVFLCEFDEPKARNTIAELALLLPPERYNVQPLVVVRGDELDVGKAGGPILFPPRVWAALSDDQRSDENSIRVRFSFERTELEALGKKLGLHARRAQKRA